jgi:pyrroline-5-carboxylate reductase
MSATLPRSLVLVGAGKMGGAMLEGWLRMGVPGSAIGVVDPKPSAELAALCARSGVTLNPVQAALGEPEVLVLGIKPQMLADAAPSIEPLAGPVTLVLSILAGKTIGNLRDRLPRAGTIARAMPNLPAAVQRGATGIAPEAQVTTRQRELATALLSGIGRVEWVDDEALIDAVTAVSGSGPAYVFLLVECLARAGAEAGLPADLAARLARATVAGAGELLHQSELAPATLRQNVTSPGGTTAAALAVLMAPDGLQPLLTAAVAAAKRRAGELSG